MDQVLELYKALNNWSFLSNKKYSGVNQTDDTKHRELVLRYYSIFSYNREEIEEEDDVEGDYNTLL